MKKAPVNDVEVREIRREDLAELTRYFFESTPEYLNAIGLRTPEPGNAEAFQKRWEAKFDEREAGGPPIAGLIVLYRGEPIGVHSSTHAECGQSLIMHAHFFRPELRGKGIGTISYVLAIEKFLIDYGFREVIFKTPIRNAAPMKVKEKLGLSPTGEEMIDWPELIEPLPVKVFRVTLADLPSLKQRAGI